MYRIIGLGLGCACGSMKGDSMKLSPTPASIAPQPSKASMAPPSHSQPCSSSDLSFKFDTASSGGSRPNGLRWLRGADEASTGRSTGASLDGGVLRRRPPAVGRGGARGPGASPGPGPMGVPPRDPRGGSPGSWPERRAYGLGERRRAYGLDRGRPWCGFAPPPPPPPPPAAAAAAVAAAVAAVAAAADDDPAPGAASHGARRGG